MIWFCFYVAACIAIGTTFGALAWNNDVTGNAPIVLASIMVAFTWPLIVPAWIYIEIDDWFAERRFNRMWRKAKSSSPPVSSDEPGTDSTRGRSAVD